MRSLFAGKKDLNRLYNLMMSYDHAGNEWQRYQYIDDKVSPCSLASIMRLFADGGAHERKTCAMQQGE